MTEIAPTEAPRLETGRPLLVAGLADHFNIQTAATIPDLWRRFGPLIDTIPARLHHTTYGVGYKADGKGNFDYLCGVEVFSLDNLPAGITGLDLPAQRYTVFTHRGHISTLHLIWRHIWHTWVNISGHAVASGPNYEFYGEDFNPQAGTGTVEIWLPIKE
jgi:AraC family transcriptional regulator